MIASSKYELLNVDITLGENQKSYPIVIDNLNSIDIKESLYSKGLVGTISFLDVNNYNELLPIIGGEYIEIFIKDIFGNTFKQKFIIVQKSNIIKEDATNKVSVVLELVEVSFFDILTKSFPYSIPTNLRNVSDIINYMIDKLEPKYKGIVDENSKQITNQLTNLYFPSTWNVNMIIDYLLEKNTTDGNTGFYFMFDKNKNKYRFSSSTDFESGDVLFYYQMTRRNEFGFIKEYQIKPNKNSLSAFNKHMIRNSTITADLNNKKINVFESDYKDYMNRYNLSHGAFSEETDTQNLSNFHYYNYKPFLYTNSVQIETDNIKTNFFRNYYEMEISVNGNLEINIGDKVYIDWLENLESEYEIYRGQWIVTEILNQFGSNLEFSQVLTLTKSQILPYSRTNRVISR